MYDKLAIAVKECLEIYSSVVPVSLLKEVRKELRVEIRQFESNRGHLSAQMDPEGLLAMLDSYHQCSLKLLEELPNIEYDYQITIDKELQKNEICDKRTKLLLLNLMLSQKKRLNIVNFLFVLTRLVLLHRGQWRYCKITCYQKA